jgi:hypothetical protein
MRRPRRIILRALLLALLLAAIFAAFWLGLVPQRFSQFAPISLDEAPSWFADFRLAALRRDPELCRAVLRAPHIKATPKPSQPRCATPAQSGKPLPALQDRRGSIRFAQFGFPAIGANQQFGDGRNRLDL